MSAIAPRSAAPAVVPAAERAPPGPARLMADTLTMLKHLGVTDRAVFDGILRTTLASHPRYLCVWSIWEPNALDGRDRDFVNRQGHDGTGRYIPLWNRGRGAIALEPNVHYETPGVGEYYLRPRREMREAIIDPYDYPVAGARRLITSQAAPVFFAGRCVGAAGIDIAVDEIPAAEPTGEAGDNSENHPQDNPIEQLLDRGFVFLDHGGGSCVSYCSGRSRRWLERFVGPWGRGQLPRRLQQRLRPAVDHEAASNPLVFARAGATLVITPFDHASTGPGLLLERRAAAPGASWPAALSSRERQVLDWMTAGKTNGEIAVILGISLHTVKRHVEKVLKKLGVPNRNAAAGAARPGRAIGPSTYPADGQDGLVC
jgi:DNA-binding CsgD family transcriptional regulator